MPAAVADAAARASDSRSIPASSASMSATLLDAAACASDSLFSAPICATWPDVAARALASRSSLASSASIYAIRCLLSIARIFERAASSSSYARCRSSSASSSPMSLICRFCLTCAPQLRVARTDRLLVVQFPNSKTKRAGRLLSGRARGITNESSHFLGGAQDVTSENTHFSEQFRAAV